MRTYFLAKVGNWMNSMPQEFINYGSNLGWISSSLDSENFSVFEEIYRVTNTNSRYYLLNEIVGSKGFRSFSEVRENIKVLSTDLELGKVLMNTATGDAVTEDEDIELQTSFGNETLSWDAEKQELVITPPEVHTPSKIEIKFDQQRHDAAVLAMKVVAKAVIEEEYDKRLMLLDLNTNLEQATFEYQIEDANAYKLNPEGNYPFLSALAEARDLTLDELSTRIITAKDRHKARVTQLLVSMNEVKAKYKFCTTTAEMNRFYEDYLGVHMPMTQAIEDGRITFVDGQEVRQEVNKGYNF